MLRLGWLCPMFVLLAACASGENTTKPPARAQRDERLVELARSQADQARRIAELEARLKLIEVDARRARGDVSRPTETIRIGERSERALARTEDASEFDASTEPSRHDDAAERPALRLRGRARPSGSGGGQRGAAELAPVPVAQESLPVVPLPAAEKRARAERPRPAAVSDSATSDYRAALRLLRERRFDDAALALSKFVSDNPDHALLDRAVYWRAEARYAKRDYRQALSEFETVIARFPSSEKAPDSLFKIGMCLRHLGAEQEARSYFRRVQEQYPNSEAASFASREGSS